MPELPEVEERLIYFTRTALGESISRVSIKAAGIIKAPRAQAFARRLRGRKMLDAVRRGKYLIVSLDNGEFLILHFGMGGDLSHYHRPVDRPEYTRLEFILSNGSRLAFTCPRNICRVMVVKDLAEVPALRGMGPEPLGPLFSLAYLHGLIERSAVRMIKPLLMDQSRIAGIGNIYADEILFEARVRPDRRASTLSGEEVKRIHRHTGRVLRRALKTAGDPDFPSGFMVSRSGENNGCRRCGYLISRATIGGRTSYYCPRCQK